MGTPLTGRKVFFITASAFAVIIAVNVSMAVMAVRTFPGLEVKNSYVASQTFDAERLAQQQLGWTLEETYEDGLLQLRFRDRDGQPPKVERLTATVGRTTTAADDVLPEFAYSGGVFSAPVRLDRGRWMILLVAYAADGTKFHQRINLTVKE